MHIAQTRAVGVSRSAGKMRTTVVIAALVAILAVFGPRRDGSALAANVPVGLPSHFAFGLTAEPDSTGLYGWMPNSGIPWDYAYAYLAAGVNTGQGWETWNPNGQYALSYAQGAASHNYVPVFTYYDLLQSNGTCDSCGEAQKDLSNLNNASLMSTYFQNFTLLMKRLSAGTYDGIQGFGKTAIVHVEPDLSGYVEGAVLDSGSCYGYCTGTGNNPAYLNASVASSGNPDVSAYPNTYQGFNWALLHLRDLYAPNVLLAFHVSDWATRQDISSSTDPSLDVVSLGQEAGSFAAQSGITGVPNGTSSYDLLFNDVADRDAGYYKYVYGSPSTFWDRLNVSFPNFHRWESYISSAGQAAGRPFMIWQVPEGNQYFNTENNSYGHYQDNRAEYFFSHVAELAQVGIIGVLFGAGNPGSTYHFDGNGDGVTNPAGFCTSDGMSSGQVCNTHTSTVSDDDGGYIRMQGQQYYANGPYPLGGTTPPPTNTPQLPTPTPTSTPPPPSVTVTSASANPSTVGPGMSTTLSATISTNVNLAQTIVDFEVYDASGAKVYQTYQSGVNFTANTPKTLSANWAVPTTQAAGTYTLKLGVFGNGWSPNYVWDDNAATITVRPLLIIGNFETGTDGFSRTSAVTSMATSTYAPAVALGTHALWTQYSIAASSAQAQIYKSIGTNLSTYSTLSMSVYPIQPTAPGASVQVRFQVQGSDLKWYYSPFVTVPSGARTPVSWNISGVPRSPLKWLYVEWNFSTTARSSGNQLYVDDIQAT